MKRFKIPLTIGIAGLLAMQVACNDSPTYPSGVGALERAPQYVEVLVHNLTHSPITVFVEIGQQRSEIGVVQPGGMETIRVQPLGMTGGPARFVAFADGDAGTLRTDPLDIMPGWTLEVTFTEMGAVVSHRADCDNGTSRCER